MRQQVGEHQAAFGVGVADTDAAARVAGDDLVGDERVAADAVAHAAELGDEAHALQAELGGGDEQAGRSRGAALVAAHAGHDPPDLEVRAAGVVGQALAGEQDRARDLAGGAVLHPDDARTVASDRHRRPRDRHQQRVVLLQLLGVAHDRCLDRGASARGLHVGGELRRRHALGVGAAQIARHAHTGVDGLDPLCRLRRERTADDRDADLLHRFDVLLTARLAGFERLPQATDRPESSDCGRAGVALVVVARLDHQQQLGGAGIARPADAGAGGLGVAPHVVVVARQRSGRCDHEAAARDAVGRQQVDRAAGAPVGGAESLQRRAQRRGADGGRVGAHDDDGIEAAARSGGLVDGRHGNDSGHVRIVHASERDTTRCLAFQLRVSAARRGWSGVELVGDRAASRGRDRRRPMVHCVRGKPARSSSGASSSSSRRWPARVKWPAGGK